MLEKGFGLASFLEFFVDSIRESLENARANPRLARALVRFSLWFHIAVLAGAFFVYYSGGPPPRLGLFARFAVYSVISLVCFTAWLLMYIGLVRGPDGRMRQTIGLANYLTLARFYLIVPVVVLFSHGYAAEALVLYVVLGLTDIADGIIARRRGEQTAFGVVMDPLADVFSTAAIFAVFLAEGLVPAWLFAILMIRYGMLIVGSFVLFLATGPIEFRATIPGKIVGVLQAIGIIIIAWCVWRGLDWERDLAPVLFPLLGLVFASIIVSQAIIGFLHLRRYSANQNKAVDFGS